MLNNLAKSALSNATHSIKRDDLTIGEGRFILDDPALLFYPVAKQADIPFEFRDRHNGSSPVFVGSAETLEWLSDRLPPPNRMNIEEILSVHGLQEYEPVSFFVAMQGRHVRDNLYIESLE